MALMTIKLAAAQADLSPGTLREYERAGLLNPQRDSNGCRLYSAIDVQQAKRVAAERMASRGRARRGAEAAA